MCQHPAFALPSYAGFCVRGYLACSMPSHNVTQVMFLPCAACVITRSLLPVPMAGCMVSFGGYNGRYHNSVHVYRPEGYVVVKAPPRAASLNEPDRRPSAANGAVGRMPGLAGQGGFGGRAHEWGRLPIIFQLDGVVHVLKALQNYWAGAGIKGQQSHHHHHHHPPAPQPSVDYERKIR